MVAGKTPEPRGRRPLRLTVRVVAPVLFAFGLYFLFTHVMRFGYVASRSMEPTLALDEYYVLWLDAYRGTDVPQRGDIVVFQGPDGDPYVKRVVGLPGEALGVLGGYVWLDGAWLREPYLKEQPFVGRPLQVAVPENAVFVLGDNRNFSEDSRDFGPVSLANILGRVTRILWPIRNARVLGRTDYDLPERAALNRATPTGTEAAPAPRPD